MARTSSRNDWGFPRWRGYGADSAATKVRICDRHRCEQPGNCPAPKSPNSPERWYFCEEHAAEYNRNWDYFQGLSAEEAAAREADEKRTSSGYAEQSHYGWAGPGDGRWSRDEMHAFEALDLEVGADFEEIKAAWRRLAKANHPDVKPNDVQAAVRFQAVQAAFEVLRAAEERRPGRE